MLTGRVLRIGVDRFVTKAELVVEVDIALPGRDVDKLFGVISPDLNPEDGKKVLFRNFISKVFKVLLNSVHEAVAARLLHLC